MRKIMSTTFVRKTWTAGMGIIFLPSVVMVNFLGCDASTIEFCLAVFVVCASIASSISNFSIQINENSSNWTETAYS